MGCKMSCPPKPMKIRWHSFYAADQWAANHRFLLYPGGLAESLDDIAVSAAPHRKAVEKDGLLKGLFYNPEKKKTERWLNATMEKASMIASNPEFWVFNKVRDVLCVVLRIVLYMIVVHNALVHVEVMILHYIRLS